MKRDKLSFMFAILAGIILVSSVLISASMMIPANDNAKEKAKAPEKSQAIGENWDLERVDFIHYAKPTNTGKPNKNTESCYKLLGVKWKTSSIDYTINPTNPNGLSEDFIINTISTSAETWDNEVPVELLTNAPSIDYTAQFGVQDYENSIDFGTYSEDGVIAVTSIWYTRRGKQIVEFDMRFNTAFEWGDANLNPALMDLQNIATHELGHAVGLDDIYSTSCSSVTMYGYSDNGDTSKRILEQADVDGLQRMYL